MKRKTVTDFLVNYSVMHVAVCRIDSNLVTTDHDYKPTIASMQRLQRLRDTRTFKVYRFTGNNDIWRYKVVSKN